MSRRFHGSKVRRRGTEVQPDSELIRGATLRSQVGAFLFHDIAERILRCRAWRRWAAQ